MMFGRRLSHLGNRRGNTAEFGLDIADDTADLVKFGHRSNSKAMRDGDPS
jgi:hypothetical protein